MAFVDPTYGSTSGAQCYSVQKRRQQSPWVWCTAVQLKVSRQLHLSVVHHVRDEGVAGSNPATPTNFPRNTNHHGERYGERYPARGAPGNLFYGRSHKR